MDAISPWNVVPAADYERYMGPEGLDQLATLSAIFQETYLGAQPDRLLVLGCGPGVGLEHVDPGVTRRVVAVDLNLQYLMVARQRFMHLGAKLELHCKDALKFEASPESFDLIDAALIFEHLHPEVLVRAISGWLAPHGACGVVLELPGGGGPPPPTPALAAVVQGEHRVSPEELVHLFDHYGLTLRRQREERVKFERKLWVGHFGR
ncbi:MAG: class I SAM-dependent methyltransferase [Anaeromyxobacter sp.]